MENLPFAMQRLDNTTNESRGYQIVMNDYNYLPNLQITDQVLMGKSEPTTYSLTGSTGFFSNDTDESADDTGTD